MFAIDSELTLDLQLGARCVCVCLDACVTVCIWLPVFLRVCLCMSARACIPALHITDTMLV